MRDPKTEKFLEEHQYRHKFVPNFALKQLGDRAAADNNPARLDRRVDPERAIQYSIKMEEGVDFPAIVVMLLEDGSHQIATGVHRWAAQELFNREAPKLDAYVVVEPVPFRRDLLVRLLNTLEGMGQSRRENLAHIADILRVNRDVKMVDLARDFGVPKEAVYDYQKEEKCVARAARLGVGDLLTQKKFSQTLRIALGRIPHDDLFAAVITLIHSYRRFGGEAAIELADAVRKAPTADAARTILAKKRVELRKEEEENKAKVRTPSNRSTRLMKHARTFLKYGGDSIDNLGLAGVPESKLPGELAVLRGVVEKAKMVMAELEHLQHQYEQAREWTRKSTTVGGQSSAESYAN